MSAAPRPRPSGGFNQGLGNFNDSFGEHLDENAMQSAVQQKALAQQATASNQPAASIAGHDALGAPELPAQPVEPREIGSIQEELVVRPVNDIVTELKTFFDIYQLLDINPATDDPATQAKKQQMLQRWQQLNQEQQMYAQEQYKIEMQKKQQAELQAQEAARQKQAAAAQSLEIPTSPQKGPVGPGAQHKPKAVQRLEQDRKTLGGPQSVG